MYLSAAGRFLKLKVHKCYINKHNLFNQVGVVAVNVLGEPVAAPSYLQGQGGGGGGGGGVQAAGPRGVTGAGAQPTHPSYRRPAGAPVGSGDKKPSPLDDLAFDMNFDPETAAKIRQVHEAKDRAVEMEEYEQASVQTPAATHM